MIWDLIFDSTDGSLIIACASTHYYYLMVGYMFLFFSHFWWKNLHIEVEFAAFVGFFYFLQGTNPCR